MQNSRWEPKVKTCSQESFPLGVEVNRPDPVGVESFLSSIWDIGLLLPPTLTQTGTYPVNSPGSPACWLQNLGLLSFHNYLNQFFIIKVSTYILLVLFPWGAPVQRNSRRDAICKCHNAESSAQGIIVEMGVTQERVHSSQQAEARNREDMLRFIFQQALLHGSRGHAF